MAVFGRGGATLLALAGLFAAAAAIAAEREAGEIFRDCRSCPELVVVPAGRYVMGSNDGRFAAERPAHLVTIPRPLAVGRYEVTFEEWQACVAEGDCGHMPDDHKWGRGRRPVINVNWPAAVGYTEWLSRRTGQTYRLPSEAEWEYAARAGTTTEYWWGDAVGQARANCRNCGPEVSHGTKPVGAFGPNPFGLFDVHGNVWEWVQDCWHSSHAGAPRDGSARLDGACQERVTRSGSWYYVDTNGRAAYRSKFPAAAFSYGIGLRVVRDLP
jgi:formylglycine-generating enzyme required for sulfatase activity